MIVGQIEARHDRESAGTDDTSRRPASVPSISGLQQVTRSRSQNWLSPLAHRYVALPQRHRNTELSPNADGGFACPAGLYEGGVTTNRPVAPAEPHPNEVLGEPTSGL
jgi:hypothetical protein